MTIARPAMMLPIAEIGKLDASDYVGLIDQRAVDCLVARLAVEGLLTPIWVRQNGNANETNRWSVIAGRHRLLAAKQLKWTEIAVEVRAGDTSKRAELRALQVAENLDRRPMRPIERALFIMERWHIEAGDAVLDTVSKASIDQKAALACGLDSARTARRYRRLHDRLFVELGDLATQLNSHAFGESFTIMTKLASERSIEDRRGFAEMILSRPDWKSIDEVRVALGRISNGNRVDTNNLRLVMLDTWGKLPMKGKRAHLDYLVEVVPKDMAEAMIVKLSKKWLL